MKSAPNVSALHEPCQTQTSVLSELLKAFRHSIQAQRKHPNTRVGPLSTAEPAYGLKTHSPRPLPEKAEPRRAIPIGYRS